MTGRYLRGLCAGVAMAAAAAAWAPLSAGSGGAGPPGVMERKISDGHTLRDDGRGGVQVQVVHLSPESVPPVARAIVAWYPLDRYTSFLVSLDTHSVDLSGYDMQKISVLRAAGTSYAPIRWEAITDSAHHRLGVLIFPRVDLPADLVITTVGGVAARVFRWLP